MTAKQKNNFKMKNIFLIVINLLTIAFASAQLSPAPKQTKSILITNATLHIGDGTVVENSILGIVDGKITIVADATMIKMKLPTFDITIDAKGKHIYPGFIAPNSTLGLVEIDAVKASDDEDEIGSFNPHIRSLIAYNAESKVIETVRPNGVLMAQITPRGGRISGTSSIVQLDAWNWEQAVVKENDGIHLNFPTSFKRSGSWFEPGIIEPNKDYQKQLDEIGLFLGNAKAYSKEKTKDRNLVLESTNGLFDGSQTLYIHANEEKQIVDAVKQAKSFGIYKIVIVGGYEANKSAALLSENNIGVLLRNVHEMPEKADDDYDLPFKLAKLLLDKNILVGLENSGDMERMKSRNLAFLAGTCAAHGVDKEKALSLITLNTAKILGIESFCGSLTAGKDATLFISEGDALDIRTNKITDAYIQGRKIDLENHQSNLNKIYKKKYNQN